MNPKTRKITFNPGACKGCEACSELAPEHFEWNQDTDMPILVRDDMDEDLAREIISCCPEDCIEFDD